MFIDLDAMLIFIAQRLSDSDHRFRLLLSHSSVSACAFSMGTMRMAEEIHIGKLSETFLPASYSFRTWNSECEQNAACVCMCVELQWIVGE